MRHYHEVKAVGQSQEEFERLRLPEPMFQALSDYQLRVVAKARGQNFPPLQ